MLGAAIVHPDFREVISLCPEMIIKQDGESKNDCERNAAKRFLAHLRREHPHLPLIINEDALSSNAPHIRDLEKYNLHYILAVKPGDHEFLFQHVDYRCGEWKNDRVCFYRCQEPGCSSLFSHHERCPPEQIQPGPAGQLHRVLGGKHSHWQDKAFQLDYRFHHNRGKCGCANLKMTSKRGLC